MGKRDHVCTRRAFTASALGAAALAATGLGCESGKDGPRAAGPRTSGAEPHDPKPAPKTSGRPRRRRRGIVGRRAPAWKVTRWYNLPTGKKALGVTDFRGKVVYLFFFQSW